MKKYILILLVLFCWCGSAWGADYNVRKGGSKTSGVSTDWTDAQVYDEINTVFTGNAILPNDIVTVDDGTYLTTLSMGTGDDGTAGNPVIITNRSGSTPIIDAGSTRSILMDGNYYDVSGLILQDATSRNIVANGNGSTTGLGTSFCDITSSGSLIEILASNQTDLTLTNITASASTDATKSIIHLNDPYGAITGSNITIFNGAGRGFYISDGVGTITLEISTLNAYGNAGAGFKTFDTVFSVGSYVDDIIATNNIAAGINIDQSENLTINRPLCTSSNYGVAVEDTTDNITIQDGECSDNIIDGFSSSANCVNTTVRRMKFFRNGDDGATSHDSDTGDYEFNLLVDNIDSGYAHINASSGTIYNSTIVDNGSSSGSPYSLRGQISLDGTASWTVKNNIVVSDGTAWLISIQAGVTLVSDNNCFWVSDPTFVLATDTPFEIDGVAKTWQQWKDAGYDANSIFVDPQFVDADNDDYSLKTSSPCINSGVIIAGVHDQATPAKDIDGLLVYTINIGASGNNSNILHFDKSAAGTQNGTLTYPYSDFTDFDFADDSVWDNLRIFFKGNPGALDLSALTTDPVIKIINKNKNLEWSNYTPHGTPANITVDNRGSGSGGWGGSRW